MHWQHIDESNDYYYKLAQRAVVVVKKWVKDAADYKIESNGKHLAALLQDKNGLNFAVDFVDRVMRPEEFYVAAKSLKELSKQNIKF